MRTNQRCLNTPLLCRVVGCARVQGTMQAAAGTRVQQRARPDAARAPVRPSHGPPCPPHAVRVSYRAKAPVSNRQLGRHPVVRAAGGPQPPAEEQQSSLFMNLFPLWVLIGCCSGLFFPQMYVSWYKPIYVTSMLAVTMLCMGFTLSVDDITQVLKSPYRVGIGAVLQYTIMPTLGFLLAQLPSMPTHFAAGIILVSCCPGGTASNIISYLARADVGLSVMMTTARSVLGSKILPAAAPDNTASKLANCFACQRACAHVLCSRLDVCTQLKSAAHVQHPGSGHNDAPLDHEADRHGRACGWHGAFRLDAAGVLLRPIGTRTRMRKHVPAMPSTAPTTRTTLFGILNVHCARAHRSQRHMP